MDETVGQSLAVAWRRPANPDPYYFSIGSMAILGETRAAAAEAVGDRLMAAVARRPNTHCGFMVHLLVSGHIARKATAEARKRLSDAAFALAIRAALARTYASPRELLRDSHGHGGEHLRHLLDLHGPRDETCPHCDRAATETQVHQRFHCPALQLQRRTVSANMMAYLLRVGAYFWFEPSQRRAYTSEGWNQAAHDGTRKRDAEGTARKAPQQLQRENPGGLLEVYTDTAAFARHIAVFTSDRWRCLTGLSTLEPASANQAAANAAADAQSG